MEASKYTNVLLTVIAIALVIIALNPWIAPRLAQAADLYLMAIQSDVSRIASDVSRIRRNM